MNSNITQLIRLIRTEILTKSQKKEKWAEFKRNHNTELLALLGVNADWNIQAGSLFDIDIDDVNGLILLNYSPTSHNLLHEIAGGWTPVLREMRGLVYSFADEPIMVSRGFEKFFNKLEMPETSLEALQKDSGGHMVVCTRKEDGHMIEYFVHNGQLQTTTRGRLDSHTAAEALKLLTLDEFNAVKKFVDATTGRELMTMICELIHPLSKVHVDYNGAKKLFLLEMYDTEGAEFGRAVIENVFDFPVSGTLDIPDVRLMTITQLLEEIEDRSVLNIEGWVAQIPNGDGTTRRVKFKYISYIGEMVKSKLSHKYLMNCLKNDRLDYMLLTLPEEIRHTAYGMVGTIHHHVVIGKTNGSGYKSLYELYDLNEGGRDNFRNICRDYWRSLNT